MASLIKEMDGVVVDRKSIEGIKAFYKRAEVRVRMEGWPTDKETKKLSALFGGSLTN